MRLPRPATWRFDFGPGEQHLLRFDGEHWHRSRDDSTEADVVIGPGAEAWAESLAAHAITPSLRVEGKPRAVQAFRRMFEEMVAAPALAKDSPALG